MPDLVLDQDSNFDQTRPVSDFKPEEVSWIFPGWIPAGKLSVLFGEPGVRKSHLALDIAARLTTARTMPLYDRLSPSLPHPLSPSPRLPVPPSPRLPVTQSPRLPVRTSPTPHK